MLKIILLISYVLDNVFDFILVKLNDSYVKKPLPENVKDVYDEEKYNKWINYRNETKKFSAIHTLVSAFITLILLIFNIHARVFYLFDFNSLIPIAKISSGNIYNYIFLILIFTLLSSLISLPFDYYQNFVIEEKYGFNKTTKKTFVLDALKSFIIGLILSAILFFAVMFFFETIGNWGIVATCAAVILFNVFIALF